MPFATIEQSTMPPKILTKIDLTCKRNKMLVITVITEVEEEAESGGY